MRHILINILLLISLISVGQNQQVLRNGFVTATDSGVYYLQDGFSEWVQLTDDSINNGIYYDIDQSVLIGISENYISGQMKNYKRNIYRKKIVNEIQNLTSSKDYDYPYYRNIVNTKYYNSILRKSFTSSRQIIVNNTTYYSQNYTYSISNINPKNICSDNDSTIIISGINNYLYKFISSLSLSDTSRINISGLHSRTTDSHEICYNEDDDEFIIVSDSGIVYTYDKTTLTTIDTLPNLPSTNTIKEVYDIEYVGGKLFITIGINEGTLCYYIIYNTVTNTFSSYVFSGYLESWASEPLLARYKDIGVLNNMCNYLISQPYLIIKTDGSTENVANIGNVNRKIFDLDYINYLQ